MMQSYTLLGVVEKHAHRFAEAKAWHEKSREVAIEMRDQRFLGQTAHNLGTVCQMEGEAARERGDEAALGGISRKPVAWSRKA